MNELHDSLHDAVAQPTPPDADDLWSRGRRAARHRTAALAVGGLLALVGAAAAMTQLADNDSALDTVDQPGEPDGTPVEDVSLPVIEPVTVEVPTGAIVTAFPVGLDDWSIAIEPEEDRGIATFMSLRQDATGMQAFMIRGISQPGDPVAPQFEWVDDPAFAVDLGFAEDVQRLQGWRDPNGEGSILVVGDEDPRSVAETIFASPLYIDPRGQSPTGWTVNFDTRDSIGGALIRAEPSSGPPVRMSTIVFGGVPPNASAWSDFGPFAPAPLEIEVMGLPAFRWNDFTLWTDGQSLHVVWFDRNDLPGRRDEFIASLRTVDTLTEVESNSVESPPSDRGQTPTDGQLAASTTVTTTSPPATGTGPSLADHWHAAYGIYECGEFWPAFEDTIDPDGIHTHADGLIHIHPFGAAATGTNATIGVFFEALGLPFGPGQIFGDGDTQDWTDLDRDGQPSETRLLRWDADDLGAGPIVSLGDDIFAAFFEQNREVWVLARVPADLPDDAIPLPLDRLEQLNSITGLAPPPS